MEATAADRKCWRLADAEHSGALPPSPPPSLTWRGVAQAAAGYALAAALYVGALALWLPECCSLAELAARAPVDYALKGALAVPVWLLVVRRMDASGWRWQLAAHAALAPLYVGAWFVLYRSAAQALDLGAPGGMVMTLSLYGCGVFYVAQFGIFHTARYVRRVRSESARAVRLAELARESEVAALKAQINPHFLFNTFHSISASVPPEEEQARRMIATLGRLMRYALSASEQERVPLSEELRCARLYLSLAEERFEERLTVSFDIEADAEALAAPVPPMILQPLVENAVEHGIATLRRGGQVRLAARRANEPGEDAIRVRVANTGPGAGGAALEQLVERGTGLQNVHERLIHSFGRGLRLARAPERSGDEGFAVYFDVPVQERAEASRTSRPPFRAAAPP